jgi:hypothetical protein
MNQVCSVFSQILQLFSRGEFERAVKKHKAERHAKGFTCWGQFVAMLFCQVAQMKSLREVCMGLASCESPLKHLGLDATPKRSTLAYANEKRPWELYQEIFHQLLGKCWVPQVPPLGPGTPQISPSAFCRSFHNLGAE